MSSSNGLSRRSYNLTVNCSPGTWITKNSPSSSFTSETSHRTFLVDFENHFEGAGQGGAQPSQQVRLRISPQAVDNNGNFHDNDWPKPDPIVDWNWTTIDQLCNPKAVKPKAEDEPSLLSQIGDALTNLTQQLPALQPKAKGMTGEEDMRPDNPGQMSEEKVPRPFDPGRTPDYPSANKPSLPTIADRVEQIEKVADWLFGDDQTPQLATEEEAERIRRTKEAVLARNTNKKLTDTCNVATATGEIDGKPVDLVANSSKVTVEGTVPRKHPDDQVLKTGPTANDIVRGNDHKNARAYDSEAKICEDILSKTTPDSTGEITITSENFPCDSCEDVIYKQMKELRPGIKIKVIYVKPYINK